jgi:hypothetical protein
MSDADKLTPQKTVDLDKKFTDVRDLRSLLLKSHPDVIVGAGGSEESRQVAEQVARLLTTLKDSEQLRFWPADVRKKIAAGNAEHRLVRKNSADQVEISEAFQLPRYAHSFLLGLEAYLEGSSWEQVSDLMRRDPRIVADEVVREFDERFKDVRNLEGLERLVRAFHDTDVAERARDKILGRLSLLAAKVIDREAKEMKSFGELMNFKESVRNLFGRPHFQALSLADCMITIDGAAIDLAESKIRSSKTRGVLAANWAEILTFPFSAAETDLEGLAKIFDEHTEKLFIKAIRQKRSHGGLDALKREIEEYEFKRISDDSREGPGEELVAILEKFRHAYQSRWKKRRD